MPSFSSRSKARLDTCDPRLVEIMEEVVKHVDCTIIQGERPKEDQDEFFRTGKSTVEWPNSKHNCPNGEKSRAVDIMMYPIHWDDWHRHFFFVGFVKAIAFSKGYKVRSGLDWDGDNDFNDQSFNDAPHFEIID